MSADINSVYFSPIPSLRHKLFNERYSAAAALSYDTIVEFNVVGSLCNEVYFNLHISKLYCRTPYAISPSETRSPAHTYENVSVVTVMGLSGF